MMNDTASTTTCDICDKTIRWEDLMKVRVPRPSDPSDLCCITWGCKDCFSYSWLSCMTEESWSFYMETPAAAKAGHLFLT